MKSFSSNHRQNLLQLHLGTATQLMFHHQLPVGLVLDLNDEYAKKCASALVMTGTSIAENPLVGGAVGQHPILFVAITWDVAFAVMPLTSPTGAKSLASLQKLVGEDGDLLIVIADGGNSYVPLLSDK
jgi:hypothetical protein